MKKVLSLVLVLMLALGALTASFAEETDKSDQLYIEVACNSNLSLFL